MKSLLISIFLLTACVCGCLAQTAANDVKVVYDPLFWKEKLKLNRNQCEQISHVNTAYYQAIQTAARAKSQKQKIEPYKLLHERSEQLWNIFSSKQKQKWRKLNLS
jgi:hypothetical protein